MKLKNIFKKIRYVIAVGYITFASILKKIYFNKNLKVYVFNSTSQIRYISPRVECEITEIKCTDDLKKYREDISLIMFIRFRNYLKNGCMGYFATKNNELLSICLITDIKKYQSTPYDIHLHAAHSNAIHVFYSHTFEKYRGYGIFPYLLSYAINKSNENTFYACINRDNISSQKAFERVGFKFAYTLKYLKLFGIEIYVKKEYVKDDKKIK